MTTDESASAGRGLSAYLSPGTHIGEYRIESFIGRGGMAFVYEATDSRLERHVALKVLAPELAQDVEFQQRFLRESRFAASLDHPNIVPIYEAGEAGGLLYMAMRHVSGGDLSALIEREGCLDPEHVVTVLSAVASALDTAHAAGLVHRDVKPGNILLTSSTGDPSRAHVYLSDFGLTKRTSSMSKLTASGMFTGTMAYIAPEQIRGQRLDARSDLYALGCVAYQCLTGVAPFVRDDQAALLWAHLSELPMPLSSHRGELAPADSVLGKALAKSPEDRYQSGADFIAALRDALLPQHGVHGPGRAAETAPRVHLVDSCAPGTAGTGAWGATTRSAATAATVMRELPSIPPMPEPGLGSRLLDWFRGARRWAIPALAVVLAAALGGTSFALLRSDDAPQTTASTAVSLPFALETYANGVEVSRTWTLSADGNRLHADVVMVGGAPGATFDEVIPKSLAASADLVTSSPPPLEVVRQDPVLRYAAPAAPGKQITLTYDIDIEALPPTRARLEAWAADQRRERDEYLSSVQAPPPTTVDGLSIRPDQLSLRADSPPHLLSLDGTDTDGQPTDPAELVKAVWTSDDADVASVDRAGVVTARSGGTATIVAQLGPTRAESVVHVIGPPRPASARTPIAPELPPSQATENQATQNQATPNQTQNQTTQNQTSDPTEPVLACADGEDDDGDGKSDFPGDGGCESAADDDESGPYQCSDRQDNDGDGAVDSPGDRGCDSPSDDDEAGPYQCSDGQDNDSDGLVDVGSDDGCDGPEDNDEYTPPPPDCADGIDNDDDTLTDGADPGCAGPSGLESSA